MSKYLFLKIVVLIFSINFTFGECPLKMEESLTLNMLNESELPRNFHIAAIPSAIVSEQILPSFEGLEELHASASGQFSLASLKTMKKTLPISDFVVVDLREESHGFLNGMAVSWRDEHNWLNKGKGTVEVLAAEQSLLESLKEKESIHIHSSESSFDIPVEMVASEAAVVDAEGLSYLRLPMTDHVRPEDSSVDQLINIIRAMPEGKWVHFHCSAGRGRATTVLTMYDMLKNGRSVSFNDILMRQWLIGGKDLTILPSAESWKTPYHRERIEFLKSFYRYCQEADWHRTLWSEWLGGCFTLNL